MSRTTRKYPTWVCWLNGFDKKLSRGQVSLSLRRVRGNGEFSSSEVWHPKSKRWAKRFRNRTLRRLFKRDFVKHV